MKVRNLLRWRIFWTKYAMGRSLLGGSVHTTDRHKLEKCSRFCLQGAIHRCYDRETAYQLIRDIEDYLDMPLQVWNDAEDTSWQDVRHIIKKFDL